MPPAIQDVLDGLVSTVARPVEHVAAVVGTVATRALGTVLGLIWPDDDTPR